ncbi:MAG: NHL repeat-containing protein [Thermomicrobiales bacterium]
MPTPDALTPDPTYDRLIQRLRQPLPRRALGGLAAGALGGLTTLSLLADANAKKKKKKKKKKSKKKTQPTTVAPTTAAPTPTSTTTAGPGENFTFQRMLGTLAIDTPDTLVFPLSIATDPDGAVYVLDTSRIIKFNSEGDYLANYGAKGAGNGELHQPEVLAVDADGWMYVTDHHGDGSDGNRLQVLDDEGEFVTFLQPGSGRLSRVDGIAIRSDNRVFATNIPPSSGSGPTMPQILAWDWDSDTSEFTFAGAWDAPDLPYSYSSGYGGNRATIDSDGWLYVMIHTWDLSRHRVGIRVLDTENECATITTYLPEQGGADGAFGMVTGIAAAADGTIYVSEGYNYRIQRFVWSGGALVYDRQYGTDGKGLENLRYPIGVAVTNTGDVVTTDTGNSRIIQLDGDLTNPRRLNPLPHAGVFIFPNAAAQDASKRVYITDPASCLVHKLEPNGAPSTAWGGYGAGPGKFDTPSGVAVFGGMVYVSDYANACIQVFNTSGAHQSTITHESLVNPGALAFDTSGVLYVADRTTNRIETFVNGAHATGWLCSASSAPMDVAVSSTNRVHVVDYMNYTVQVFSTDGELLDTYPASIRPKGLALGAADTIYVGSDVTEEIRVLSSTGQLLTTLDANEVSTSNGLLIDADGNLLQISRDGVRRFTPSTGRQRPNDDANARKKAKRRKKRKDHKGGKRGKRARNRSAGKGRKERKQSTARQHPGGGAADSGGAAAGWRPRLAA